MQTYKSNEDTHELLRSLRKTMQNLQPQPAKHHEQQTIFIHKNLNSTTHVFIRRDAVTPALQPTYDGPYQVMKRSAKNFRLKINGRSVTITIDRLKPAYILREEASQTEQKPPQPPQENHSEETQTRSGRKLKPPVRFTSPACTQRRG